MERHQSNAMQVAQFLDNHPGVQRVIHPFLPSNPQAELSKKLLKSGKYCGMLAVFIKGGNEETSLFLDSLEIAMKAPSLGGVHTVGNQPAFLSHAYLSAQERNEVDIKDNLVRLSIGLENVQDIIGDLDQALNKVLN